MLHQHLRLLWQALAVATNFASLLALQVGRASQASG